MNQKPSVGRIVHYMAPTDCGGETYAGIITEVVDETHVCLATFGRTSLYFNGVVEYGEQTTPGCWSWPPRL